MSSPRANRQFVLRSGSLDLLLRLDRRQGFELDALDRAVGREFEPRPTWIGGLAPFFLLVSNQRTIFEAAARSGAGRGDIERPLLALRCDGNRWRSRTVDKIRRLATNQERV